MKRRLGEQLVRSPEGWPGGPSVMQRLVEAGSQTRFGRDRRASELPLTAVCPALRNSGT